MDQEELDQKWKLWEERMKARVIKEAAEKEAKAKAEAEKLAMDYLDRRDRARGKLPRY